MFKLSLLGGLIKVLPGIGASKLVGIFATFDAIVSTRLYMLAFRANLHGSMG
jgi:hypothetical protein